MNKLEFGKLIDAVCSDLTLAENLVLEFPGILHAKNGIGETVLHYLAVENKIVQVNWLLSKGANINTTNDFGDTPLSEASSLGYFELCRVLLEKGAVLCLKTPEGDTALSEAAINDHPKIVALLLNHIKTDEQLRNYFSNVTFDVLLDKKCESAKLLFNHGFKW